MIKIKIHPPIHLLSILSFLEPITAVSGIDVGDMMGRLSVKCQNDRKITTLTHNHTELQSRVTSRAAQYIVSVSSSQYAEYSYPKVYKSQYI